MATDKISAMLGTPGTWLASTCRSGSEMVISMPTTKPISAISHTLRDFVMVLPTASPIGIIDRSAPSVNAPMPNISSTAPITNASSALVGTGIRKKQIRNPRTVIGSTEEIDSFHFSLRMLCVFFGILSILSL